MTIYLDDVEFRSGDTRELFSNYSPNGISTETYETPKLKYEDFLRLLEAKKVEMKLGQTRFTLSPEHIEALGDLKKAIEQ